MREIDIASGAGRRAIPVAGGTDAWLRTGNPAATGGAR